MAICFVSDNFSRNILGWSIDVSCSAQNVKRALGMAMQTIRKHYPQHLCARLVADGGSENHAISVEKLLDSTDHPEITKVIALKDIAFSNSPIEAINKIAKNYLSYLQPASFSALVDCISFTVADYTSSRPHGSLRGLTPLEAYSQQAVKLDFSNEQQNAKFLRIEENRKGCGRCL